MKAKTPGQEAVGLLYLSESFVAFLVPAVEVLSGVEDEGLAALHVSEPTVCRSKWRTDNHVSR